ncbi:MAG: 5'-methylthioadenosine/adenosylhomocysteine nucleosidase [Candidatus Woesearchaeota archaeon]|jgi:5'-methylthioadenosine/S-adenosylhomocysteine nucleosidase
MTKIGIIGAMDEEIEAYLKHIDNLQKEEWKIFTFYMGKFYNHDVVIVKSGVGKVFAAMVCQIMIDKYNVDTVLFTGVGGALNKKLNIGDVVVSVDSVHHDFNAMPLGFKRGQISYTDYRFFKAEKKLLDIALKTKIESTQIIEGRILTGDQFFTQADKQSHSYLLDELEGDCIEMEGAAVAQVCTINDIPHLIVRTVSDKADGTAVKDYNTFKSIIAKNSFKVVEEIVKGVK